MIRLIACDIDGTLIPYGERDLPEGLFPLVRALHEKGIQFCPASGRQYHSLRALFEPIADTSCFLCENGAAIFGPSDTEAAASALSKTVFPREEAVALCKDIAACPNSEVLISGVNMTYVCTEDPDLIAILDLLGNRYRVISSPEEVTEDIIKVSAYCKKDLPETFARLAPWGKRFRMAEAGPIWIDFTLSDKGTGITALCEALGIPLSDVAAFGDNWNDLAMLRTVGHPYIMSTADPELLVKIPSHCDDPLTIMQDILEGTIG